MKKLLGLAGAAAAVTYFFDPNSGARRRALVRDKIASVFRGGARKTEQLGRSVASEATGVAQKVTHLREEPKEQPDDVTLARKVETEIFRDDDVPKGQININAEDGKIVLRGEVERPEMIRDLEERARNVQGVRDVENLLHTPGEPAPMHE